MHSLSSFKDRLYNFHSDSFESVALKMFYFQSEYNPVYKKYLNYLKITPGEVKSTNDIPFLPIEMFKSFEVKTGNWTAEKKFLSSGTTSKLRSAHFIEDISFYHLHSRKIYEDFYPNLSSTTILALLPSYIEQGDSGLVSMIDSFIANSVSKSSGYYLDDHNGLENALKTVLEKGENAVLFGVTYALLEFANHSRTKFEELTVIETGGMKGRGEEITKMEMHTILKERLGVKRIHSEYGMTELMSQAYSSGEGLFKCSKWMKVVIRDVDDPFNTVDLGKTGVINIIDLANIHSCCFIESKDIGKLYSNDTFEILGRMDNSEVRGCNLLIN